MRATMSDSRFRHGRLAVHRWQVAQGWPVRFGQSMLFAGFLAVMAQISFPLPWTPVPFSMAPFALLVTGAVQRKGWAGLSVLLYLAAGALGAPVYAGGASGAHHLVGATAGYLWGFVLASVLVGWYVERRRRLLDGRAAAVVAGGLGVLGVFSLATFAWIAVDGNTFTSETTTSSSLLWLFLALTGLVATGVVAWLMQSRGGGIERFNLFLVMLAAIAAIHVPGVIVLAAVTPLGWADAVALGSVVFLPFDLVKAGVATSLSLAFLPTRSELEALDA